jgi:N6-L-threonylcarbamoyladenine synthase
LVTLIVAGTKQERLKYNYFIKQIRKNNRKLFKGDRSHIKNTAPRFIYGFQRYDKVLWKNIECFIFGRRSTGYFDIRKLDNTKLHSSLKYTELKLLEKAKTLLTEIRFPLPLNWEIIAGVSSGGI